MATQGNVIDILNSLDPDVPKAAPITPAPVAPAQGNPVDMLNELSPDVPEQTAQEGSNPIDLLKSIPEAIGAVPKGIAQGQIGVIEGIASEGQWLGDTMQKFRIPGGEFISKEADLAKWYWRSQLESKALEPSGYANDKWSFRTALPKFANLTGQALPSLVHGAGIGAMFGPHAALANLVALGGLEAAPEYVAAREGGVAYDPKTGKPRMLKSRDYGRASSVGATNWVLTSLLEKYPMDIIMSGKLGKTVLKGSTRRIAGALGEGFEEALQQLSSNLVAKVGYDKARRAHEGLVDAAVGGLGAGFTMTGVMQFAQKQKWNNTKRILKAGGMSEQDIKKSKDMYKILAEQEAGGAVEAEEKYKKKNIEVPAGVTEEADIERERMKMLNRVEEYKKHVASVPAGEHLSFDEFSVDQDKRAESMGKYTEFLAKMVAEGVSAERAIKRAKKGTRDIKGFAAKTSTNYKEVKDAQGNTTIVAEPVTTKESKIAAPKMSGEDISKARDTIDKAIKDLDVRDDTGNIVKPKDLYNMMILQLEANKDVDPTEVVSEFIDDHSNSIIWPGGYAFDNDANVWSGRSRRMVKFSELVADMYKKDVHPDTLNYVALKEATGKETDVTTEQMRERVEDTIRGFGADATTWFEEGRQALGKKAFGEEITDMAEEINDEYAQATVKAAGKRLMVERTGDRRVSDEKYKGVERRIKPRREDEAVELFNSIVSDPALINEGIEVSPIETIESLLPDGIKEEVMGESPIETLERLGSDTVVSPKPTVKPTVQKTPAQRRVEAVKKKVTPKVKPTVKVQKTVAEPAISAKESMSERNEQGVVPRAPERKSWNVGDLNAYRDVLYDNELGNIRIVDTSQLKNMEEEYIPGIGINKERTTIGVNPKALLNMYDRYVAGQPLVDNEMGKKVVKLPAGMNANEFFQFAIEHERVHLATGLDGGVIDEDLASALALERIGRPDLAASIIGRIPGNTGYFASKAVFKEGAWVRERQGDQPVRKSTLLSEHKTGVKELDVLTEKINEEKYENVKRVAINYDKERFLKVPRKAEQQSVNAKTWTKDDKELARLRVSKIKGEKFGKTQEYDEQGRRIESGAVENVKTQEINSIIRDYETQFNELDKNGSEQDKKSGVPILKKLRYEELVSTMKGVPADITRKVWKTISTNTRYANAKMTAGVRENFIKYFLDDPKRSDIDSFNADIRGEDTTYDGFNYEDFLGGKPSTAPSNATSKQHPTPSLRDTAVDLDNVLRKIKLGFVADHLATGRTKKKVGAVKQELRDPLTTGIFSYLTASDVANGYGKVVTDATIDFLADFVKKKHGSDPRSFRHAERQRGQKFLNDYDRAICFAAEEIGVNFDGPNNAYWESDIGIRRKHDNPRQAEIFAKYYAEVRALMKVNSKPLTDKEVDALKAERPALAFFNLLPSDVQDYLVWSKNQIQNTMLKAGIDMNVWDDANMLANIQKGYVRRIAVDDYAVKRGSPGSIKSTYQPQRKQATYEEFVEFGGMSEAGKKLNPVVSYSLALGGYIGNSIELVNRQMFINKLKNIWIDEADGLKLIEYVPRVKAFKKAQMKDASTKSAEGYLREKGYVKANELPGLTEWFKGAYYVPWIPADVKDLFDSMLNVPKAGTIQRKIQQVGGVLKRIVMYTPMMYVVQIGSTLGLWADPGIVPGKRAATFAKEIALMFPRWAIPALRKNIPPRYKGVDPKKLDLFFRNGLRGLDIDQVMESLYKYSHTKNSAQRDKVEEILHQLGTKFGLDTIAFEQVLSRVLYDVTDAMYMRLKKKHPEWTDDKLASTAVAFTNDASGLINPHIYGEEGNFIRSVAFSRDFNYSFFRQLTGAMTYLFEKASFGRVKVAGTLTGRHFAGKHSRLLNSLLHGEKDEDQMRALSGYYAANLGKVAVMYTAVANLIQFGLSYLDDDDEEKGTWSFQNPKGKKLAIRMPFKYQWGDQVYVNPIFWREFPNIIRWASQPFDTLKSKASVLMSTMIDLASNVNFFGEKITDPYMDRGEKFNAMVMHAANNAMPQPLNTKSSFSNQEWGRLWVFAANMSAMSLARGSSLRETEGMHENLELVGRKRYLDDRVRRELRLATPEQAREMLADRKIDARQYMNHVYGKRYPYMSWRRKNRRALIEAERMRDRGELY